jgi:hypothetical protein
MGFVLACPSLLLAQDGGQNQGANRNAKGPNVVSRSPGLRIRAGLDGPQIAQSEEQAYAPSRVQGVFADLINAMFLGLNQIVPLIPQLFLPGEDVSIGVGDVFMTEVASDGRNSFAELRNPSSLRLEMDQWAFCTSGQCSNFLRGVVMDPGDILVFQLGGEFDGEIATGLVGLEVDGAVGELAFYNFAGRDRDPEDGNAMVDYLQWGGLIQAFGLEEVAAGVGLWARGSAISDDLRNNSIQLNPDQLQTGGRRADHYTVVSFDSNSLGATTSAGLQDDPSTGDTTDPGTGGGDDRGGRQSSNRRR